jgi:carbamoyl-phosphate synthase large subunit
VLATGVGAIIGQGIIKSLRLTKRSVKIIGLDLNPDAFGYQLCDAHYAKPNINEDQSYLDFLGRVIEQQQVDIIMPGIEQDVFFFNQHREFFEQLGVILVLNTSELIEISRDKSKTMDVLQQAGMLTIPGLMGANWSACIAQLGPPPLLLKPCTGNGSRGIVKLYDNNDFNYWSNKSSGKFIIQKIVGNDEQEYTASVFGLRDGQATCPIVFKRKLSSTGFTQSIEIVDEPLINQRIAELNELLCPLGPTNYQFRKEEDQIFLLEVNPRISSATSLRAGFNFNEPWMCIDYFIHGNQPNPHPAPKGQAVRYTEDWIKQL